MSSQNSDAPGSDPESDCAAEGTSFEKSNTSGDAGRESQRPRGQRQHSRSHSPGADASVRFSREKHKKDKKSRSKQRDKSVTTNAHESSRSDDRHRSASRDCSSQGAEQDGGRGAVVDMKSLGPMIADLIDRKLARYAKPPSDAKAEKARKKRDHSPSPDTDSDQDSVEHSRPEGEYSSSEDSDSDSEDEPPPKGRSRRCDRHDARALSRRRRRSLTPRKHGGNHVNSGDSSENESDPFAALNQFATQSTSAQPLDNGDKYAQAIGDIENFFDSRDKTGDSVNEKFDGIFDNGLRRAPNDKLLLEYMDKYPRPQNIPKLAVPKTYDCIWEALKRGPQVTDASVQKVQTVLSKALVPIINMVDDIGSGKGTTKPVADYLDQLTDAFRLGSAAFSLLNQARRDIIQNDLGYPTSKICNWQFKMGDTELFEGDVTKKLKELKEQNRQFRSQATHRPSNSRGFSFGRRDQGRDAYRLGRKSHRNCKSRGSGKKFNGKPKRRDQRDCEYVSNDNNDIFQESIWSNLTNTPKKFSRRQACSQLWKLVGNHIW